MAPTYTTYSGSRVLIVDDTDPSISYSGPWRLFSDLSNVSREYNSTIHRADAAGQSLSYTFEGTSISVFGSLDNPDANGSPEVRFIIDNLPSAPWNATGSLNTKTDRLMSHQALFRSFNLLPGTHTLTIDILNSGPEGPFFYFDYFTISTGDTTSYLGQRIESNADARQYFIVDDRDLSINYIPPWNTDGIPTEYFGTTSVPSREGAVAIFAFDGPDISVFATIDPIAANGGVTIDFELDGVPVDGARFVSTAEGGSTYNNKIFSRTGLSNSNHSLKIIAEENVKWFLDYIVYGGDTGLSSNATGNPDGSVNVNGSGGADETTSSQAKKGNGGAVAGGVIGGLLGLSLLVFLIFFLLRRRRKNKSHVTTLAAKGFDMNVVSYGGYDDKDVDGPKPDIPLPPIPTQRMAPLPILNRVFRRDSVAATIITTRTGRTGRTQTTMDSFISPTATAADSSNMTMSGASTNDHGRTRERAPSYDAGSTTYSSYQLLQQPSGSQNLPNSLKPPNSFRVVNPSFDPPAYSRSPPGSNQSNLPYLTPLKN